MAERSFWDKVGFFAGDVLTMGALSSQDAAREQRRAAKRGEELTQSRWEDYLKMQEPYSQTGEYAAGELRSGLAGGFNFDPEFDFNAPSYTPEGRFSFGEYQEPGAFSFGAGDMYADPGYRARMDAGLAAVQGSAAARGTGLSGGTLKDLMSYGSGLASEEYGKAYGRTRGAYESDRAFGRGAYESDRAFGFGDYMQNRDFGYNKFLNDLQFGYGTATDKYNRNMMATQARMNLLQSMAGYGQTSMGQLGGYGMNMTGQQMGAIYGQGNAAAVEQMAPYRGFKNVVEMGAQVAPLFM